MTRQLPRAAVAAGALASLLALTSCSLGYEPPGTPSTALAEATAPQHSTSGTAATAGTTTPGGTRQRFVDRVTRETACAGEVTEVDGTGDIVRLTGDCATVTVSGTGVVVLAERVASLEVDATGATVVVASVEKITLAGSTNVVVWESGNPKVTDTGTANEAHRDTL